MTPKEEANDDTRGVFAPNYKKNIIFTGKEWQEEITRLKTALASRDDRIRELESKLKTAVDSFENVKKSAYLEHAKDIAKFALEQIKGESHDRA